MAFQFQKLDIPDLVLVTPDVFGDERGFFAEVFKASVFAGGGVDARFVQINHSKSSRGVLRGLHYQNPPAAQGKLVSVVAGEIFDVAVDIRRNSPTFGKWAGVRLNARDKKMLYIPEGFAHGFCTLADATEVIYYCTAEYSPKDEGGIIYNDPEIGIAWPVKDPVLSPKDAEYPGLKAAVNQFSYES